MFAKFVGKYYVSQNSFKELAPYRKRLEQEVHTLQERHAAVKPFTANAETEPTPETIPAHPQATYYERGSTQEMLISEADKLDTRSRMQAILGDDRAGFLPRSNGEKNIVLSYLDYLNNDDYPEGVPHQWFEVMTHVQKYRPPTADRPKPKRYAASDGIRAVESIVWQLADYYADAQAAVRELRVLQTETDNILPSLKVLEADEANRTLPGLERLIRGHDIEAYVKKGQVIAPVADPLAGTVSRFVDSTERGPGRHKVVYDQYTQPDRAKKKPQLEAYLQARCADLTVKEVQQLLPGILEGEQKRAAFMQARLEDALRLEGHRLLASVVRAAEDSLQTDVPLASRVR
jgi:hypothetical protein